jgi:hypothetical protein
VNGWPCTQTAARHEPAAALGVDPAEYDLILTETYRERFRGVASGVEESLAWVAARLGVKPSAESFAHAAKVRVRTERAFAEPRHSVHLDVPAERGGSLALGPTTRSLP